MAVPADSSSSLFTPSEPLDRSPLLRGGDVSSARRRRRRSTKKVEARGLAQSQGGLELSSLESFGSSKTQTRSKVSYSNDRIEGAADGLGVTRSSNNIDLQDSRLTISQLVTATTTTKQRQSPTVPGHGQLDDTTGQRRSPKPRYKDELSPSPFPAEGMLEDSTDGVASILKKKLHQLDLDRVGGGKPVGGDERTLAVSRHSADEGHSSDIGAQASLDGDEDDNQMGARERGGGGVTQGRPLPLPSITIQTEGGSESVDPRASTDMLGITIHGTDELQASVLLTHPSVRVSIVDTSELAHGSLLKKSIPEKCVTSYYERGNPSVDYIMPIMTKPFGCREQRRLTGILKAQWEETLTFNEQLSYFTSNEDVVIFFELLDFVSGGGGRGYTSNTENGRKPWHRIAWAFLCPAGKGCTRKIGEKTRLQLYKYPRNLFGHSTESSEVYNLWCRQYRRTYPSTLYVTIKGISTALPQEPPAMRSMFPLQEEMGSITFEQMLQLQVARKSLTGVQPSALMSASMRLPGQACQIPTSHLTTQYPTPMGCSALAFSHSGHLLAAGCAHQTTLYPLVIYEIPSFKPVLVTEGHRGIIYQVVWNREDRLLASISADGIVKLWSLKNASCTPVASLPHPCYVYSACFITGAKWGTMNVLATGAYDGYVRIWSLSDEDSVQIIGEFHGHSGHINCLAWCSKTSVLYAGDSKGILGAWHRERGAWMLKHKTDVMDGQSLVSLSLHPNGRKILLHTRKAKLAMLDVRVDHLCREYTGIKLSGMERCASLLSPCGELVFAGAPSGTVHVWHARNARELHVYSDLPFTSAVGAMSYHPSEHLLVLSSFGDCQPLVALNHLVGSRPAATHEAGDGAGDGGMAGDEEEKDIKRKSQVRDSQRFSDLVETLNRVTAKAKS